MKEQVKSLWKLCFPDDSDDFVALYFSSRYTDEINSAITENGRVVSALQRIPYPMRFNGAVIPVAYISGACTHPDFRSRGLMSRLLDEAHRKMYADGKYLSVLIPANKGLVDYYSRSGYDICFQQDEKLLTGMCKTVDNFKTELIFNELDLLKKECSEVCDFINRQLSTYQASILHPFQDMNIVLADLALSGGKVWYANDKNGNIRSVVLLIADESRIVIKELLSVDNQSETAMLGFISSHYTGVKIVKPSPCGMVRVINAYGMLGLMADRLSGGYVEIYGDSVIPENNGLYLISDGGVCRKISGNDISCDTERLRLHINNMPSWLFRDMEAHISLMLD